MRKRVAGRCPVSFLYPIMVISLLSGSAVSQSTSRPPAAAQQDIPAIIQAASPSVVTIVLRDQTGRELGTGSGFVKGSEGIIVTNAHVIQLPGATQAEVRFPDGSSYQVQGVIAIDNERDLAIVRLRTVGKEFPTLRLGDSEHVQIGQKVIAIGSPLAGFSTVSTETTVSDGIVSGIREWPNGKMKVLQITAPVSPGSSGGALLDSSGEVIGVTFAQLKEGQNLNFAIPSTYITQLEAGASGGAHPFPLQQDDQKMASQSPTVPPQEMLQSAKTLCVWVNAGSAVLKSEISGKLLEWGKLTLVSSPSQADLVLEITQTGQLNVGTGAGNQATAILKDRASGIELWSKTKGGGWAMSGWSNAWVARALASEFTKFFDNAMKSASKHAPRGKG